MTTCRLLTDPSADGAWNMAVDEVLLDWAGRTGRCVWRFYRWEPATLSLGYFQPYEDRLRHPASAECPVVRRLSGGGAILHDRELTYSFAVPRRHRLARDRLGLYRAVHDALVAVLAGWGVEAAVCCPQGDESPPTSRFLCFQRRSPGDVLAGPWKIAGSAQRRSAHAVLQHGSVVLGRSAAAPELAGLADLSHRPPSEDELADAWLGRLAETLGLTWEPVPLDDEERRRAAELVRTKYGCPGWTRNRNR